MVPSEIRTSSPALPRTLLDTLEASIQGDMYLPHDQNFWDYSKMFNGNVQTSAKALICPMNALDVSKIILFCSQHGLCPSVKAGGYGTAGWAVGGDIILDLSKIVDIDIELPKSDGSFTSLRDLPKASGKGKERAGVPIADHTASNGGKRRRTDDELLRSYDDASLAVATFLAGPPLPPDPSEPPRPVIRRKIEYSINPPVSRVIAVGAHDSSPLYSTFGHSRTATSFPGSVSFPTPVACSAPPVPPGSDPFAYIHDSHCRVSPLSVGDPNSRAQLLPSMYGSDLEQAGGGWRNSTSRIPGASNPSCERVAAVPSPDLATIFPNPTLPSAPQNLLTHTQPLYPYVYVSFGAGMRQKEVDRFTAANPIKGTCISGAPGLVPYHVPFSAHPVGSSIMLLGGFGFLGRLHGLSIDNLVEVEMILSDGRIVIVNERDHPELWWALRGAGPAFGVATRYKARAYPVPIVFAGNLVYRFHRATAPSLLKHFRDCVKNAPRQLYANVLLTAGPEDSDSLVVIQICYVGSKEKGQEHLAAISSWDGEQCLLNEVNEKSFLFQQDSVAQVLRGKAGRQWYIRSALITSLPDDIINQTIQEFADTPIGCTWLFELAGGAIADFDDTCVPALQREATFTVAALHQWEMGTDDPRCVQSAEDWISSALKPVSTGAPFPSFLGRHEPLGRTISCFGSNWSRLCELKKKYDPTCLFRSTFWPLDAAGHPLDPRAHEPPSPVLESAPL